MAGRGPREACLKSLVPLELTRKIIFLGELSENEKWEWLNLADIFIMPARDIIGDFEGFGIVYLEAALCKKPVIAGNSGGVNDAVVSGKTGLIVDPENIKDISLAIEKLVTNSDLRIELGKNGQERAWRDFNWEKRITEIAKFIK
jgi:phosphatidylinositol alpha-1,6-mannosyltransferase